MSCFLYFLIFLEVSHCCVHVWRIGHLFQSLLTGLRREMPPISPDRDSEAFSHLFCGYSRLTPLVSPCGRALNFVCLVLILRSPAGCWRPPISLLPLGWCCTSSLYALSQSHSVGPASCACSQPSAESCCLHHWGCAHMGASHRVRRCVGEVRGALVVLMVELMDMQASYPQWLIGGFPDRVSKAIGRFHVLLPSKSPAASPCPTVIQHTTVFWIGCERSGSLWQCPAQLGKPGTHSHGLTLPPGRNHRLRSSLSPKLCWPGEIYMGKLKLFLSPFHWVQSQISFCSSDVLEHILWTPGLPQRHSQYGWLGVLWG